MRCELLHSPRLFGSTWHDSLIPEPFLLTCSGHLRELANHASINKAANTHARRRGCHDLPIVWLTAIVGHVTADGSVERVDDAGLLEVVQRVLHERYHGFLLIVSYQQGRERDS